MTTLFLDTAAATGTNAWRSSARTVGNHLAHIYDKIGRRTRAGAAVYAIEAGLLPAEAGETRR